MDKNRWNYIQLDDKEICEKYKNGLSTIKLAKYYDVSVMKIRWVLFDNNIKDTRLLWHGSRSENFWNIINTGLVLRPNAVVTGKLYGFGIYFAPRAVKSLGYTSLSGSYWSKGNSTSAFMALNNVAYGKPYDVYDFDSRYYNLNHENLQKMCLGAHSLHAHAGANLGHTNLRNDEIVVYREEQCTIKYLIELRS